MEPKTKTYEPDQEKKGRSTPASAHKLAVDWTANLVIDGELTSNGKMDFKKMDAQGVLKNGSHTNGTQTKNIDADATPVTLPDGTQTFAVVVRATDGSAVYKGILLRDKNNEMSIVGVFKLNPGLPQDSTLPPSAQDEGVWVITKP